MSYTKTIFTRSGVQTDKTLLPDLIKWLNQELTKIEVATQRPDTRGIQFEVRYSVPTKYKEGDLYYGAAGVFGGSEGLYIRDAGNWRRL
jgi:hypothetical protein